MDVYINSKKVQRGSAFVPIIGEKHNGHDFIEDAIAAGAVRVYHSEDVSELKKKYPDVEFIFTENTTLKLGQIAKEHLQNLRKNGKIMVFAITGSVGKTTTKDILGQLLSHFNKTIFAKESYNNEIGVPLTILEADETTRYLVLEFGANHVGEIEYLTKLVTPDVPILLKAGVAHAGEFGGTEAILQEKTKIFVTKPMVGIVQGDDENSDDLIRTAIRLSDQTHYQRLSKENFSNIQTDEFDNLSFDYRGQRYETNFAGLHQLYNIQAALLAAIRTGYESEAFVEPLKQIYPVAQHRMQVKQYDNGIVVIDDSYNANPDSMKAGIDALLRISKESGKKSVAVLGEMLELGESSARLHAVIGRYAIDNGVDEVWTCGALSEHYGDLICPDRKHQVSAFDSSKVESNVVYLFKASSANKLWEKIEEVVKC